MTRYDNPNVAYSLMGQFIQHLANMGATDKELRKLFKKGSNATLLDIATIEVAHTHYEEECDE